MAKHTPPDDTSFTLSLVRHLGAAVALVAVVAAAFWGIGQVRDDGSSMTVASSPDTSDEASDGPTVVATPEPSDPPTSEAPPADEGTAAPTAEATPTEAATDEPDEPAATGTEEAPSTSAGDLDPADISVQVLDATGEGGETMDDVVAQLESDGFDVVATNRAVREYEVTTVFYTPGNEAKAQRIAEMYGYREVAPEPGNLSHSVDVHLVVGLDA
ncbi:MAG: LytR C-terminal domain-containing protein [Actinobacteria bacterium]|nr:LytR C-terminal domain-containing protein [Actinomycetota bacterium]